MGYKVYDLLSERSKIRLKSLRIDVYTYGADYVLFKAT
jgi:hypothetical protein